MSIDWGSFFLGGLSGLAAAFLLLVFFIWRTKLYKFKVF